MFGFIRVRLEHRRKCKQWRETNSHNDTFLNYPLYCAECVSVGRGTYGPINVEMSRKDYRLRIGNYCSIANGVTFVLSSEHPTNHISTYPFKVKVIQDENPEAVSKGDIIVEDDVWIGFGATVLSSVRIGQGAVVAAGAVVTKDVPPYAIVGGVPAKVIKYRFTPELIEELLQVDFSQLDDTAIKDNINALYEELRDPEQLAWLPKK